MDSIPYAPDMVPGHGYNLLLGDALPSPAVVGKMKTVEASGGQQVVSRIIRVESSASLSESLGVSVSASGGYAGIKGSAKTDFSESSQFNEYSKFLLVQVTVRNATMTYEDPQLAPDAVELIQLDQRERFRQRFGDVFLSGLERGGEFFAVYEISGTDETEKETIAVSVEASFNGVIASADLQTTITTAKQRSKSSLDVRTHVFQQGAVDETVQSVEDIMNRAKRFPISVAGELAYPYAMLVEEYSTLRLPNDSFTPLDVDNQREVLADYAQRRLEALTLRNNLHYVLQQPDAFDGADVDTLRTWLTEVTAAINLMQKQASACAKDASKCEFTAFDPGTYLLPKLKPADRLPPTVPFPIIAGMDWRAAKQICETSGLTFDDNRSEEGFLRSGPGALDQDGRQIPWGSLEDMMVDNVYPDDGGHPADRTIAPGEIWRRQDPFWMFPTLKPGSPGDV